MNNKLVAVLAFVTGAVAGAAVTYKLVTKKYEELIDKEVQSVKDTYASKFESKVVEPAEDDKKVVDEALDMANELLDKLNYTSTEGREIRLQHTSPYPIAPSEFGELDNYDTESMMCYSNKILVDADGKVVEDWFDRVGPEYWKHFGEYEPDSAYFRNDEYQTDYELILCPDDFPDAGRG